ncbi:MAG: metallophosphoesterase [Planctomycetes bacterium]|nr:metallophosphoesterase [Planctomycetota bacterium]
MKLPFRLLGIVSLGFALGACGEAPESPSGSAAEAAPSIIVAGHLYSLGVRSHDESDDRLLDDRWLEAFATEIRRRRPQAVFLLGDSTRNGGDEEWRRLDRIFAGLEAPLHYLAGNHDLRSAAAFDRHGGVRNQVFDLAGTRLIALDAKCVYEAEDLAFLRRSLDLPATAPRPLILMHYCMIDWRDAQPGQDPREDYPGVSNWNREVVPIIAGRVEMVICGDHQPGGPKRRRQVHDGRTIDYLLTSFGFRRADGQDRAGEGPNLFVELIFGRDGLRALPRVLPVALDDDWYLDPRPPEDWVHHEVFGRGWIWSPRSFLEVTDDDAFRIEEPERGIELEIERRPWPAAADLASVQAALSTELVSKLGPVKSFAGGDFELLFQPARWEWLEVRGEPRFYVFARVKDELWIFAGRQRTAAPDDIDWRALLLEMVRSLKLA